jgi:Carboxypeptidase regulatory-like domain
MNAIVRFAFRAGIVLTAIVLQFEYADADVCVYKPPKVRRVCGTIVDSSGRPIPAVKVTVLKDGTAVKNDATDENGEFDFEAIQPGKYELDARTPGFQPARYQLTLSKPTNSCKHALRIEMEVGGIHCGGDIRETKNPLARKH